MSPLPSSSVPPECVDPDAIAVLRSFDEGGPPLIFSELVELFNESTPQLLTQACDAIDAPARLAAIAHTLKGSCTNFGAHHMEKLCLDLEELGRARKSEGARELIMAIEEAYFQVRASLGEYCAGRK